MNKIIVEVSIGELLDKVSILEIKQEKIKDTEKLKFINNEHSALKDQLEKNVKSDEKLVAVDVTSNYPMEAKELPSIGYVRALSAEGILSLNPSVIIGEDDMGPIEVIDQIKKSGVPIVAIAENHSIEGIIEKVRCVATIIGKSEYADEILMENVYM